MDGITIFIAAIIIFICALPLGLAVAISQQPWLLLVCLAAIVLFFMARSSRRNMR